MSNMALGVHHQVPSGYGLLKSQPTGVITKAGPCGADGKPKNSSDEEFSRCSRKTSSDYGASQLPKLEFVADDATRKSSSSDLDSINVSDSPPPVINIGLDSKRLKEETRADQDRLDRDSQSSEPPRLTPVNESSGELIVTDPGSIDEPQKSFGLTFDKKWLK